MTLRRVTLLLCGALLLAACTSGNDDAGSNAESTVPSAVDETPTTESETPDSNAAEQTTETTSTPESALASEGFLVAGCGAVTNEFVASELFTDPTVECGYVTVPADWDDPDGDTIQIAVYVIPATGPDPAPDPLVYLEGGPGGSAVATAVEFIDGPASYLRERRDVVVVDQRGTGYSIPALFCPEIGSEDVDPAGHQACRDRLATDGVDPGDYNSVNNALDIDAVRQAIGYDEWNLYGLSYGTRLALTSMRDTPEGIRSVILDSVFPPQINGMSESAYTFYWAIDQIAANCAADPDCDIDAKALIEDGIARLSEAPVGEFDAAAYLGLLSGVIAEPQAAVMVATIASGTDEDIAAALEAMSAGEEDEELPPLDQVDPEIYPLLGEAVGMGYGVVCAEEAPFLDVTAGPLLGETFRETTRAAVNALPQPFDASLCSIWDVPSAGEIATQAVSSNIPTLILAGTADVATPPEWSRLTGETLANSTYLEFAGLTHGLLGNNDCLNGLTTDFLSDPTVQLDQGCVDEFPRVDYDPAS